jgi:hypothetical protein
VIWLTARGLWELIRQCAIGVREGFLGEVGECMNLGGDEQQSGRFPPRISGLTESWDEEEGEVYRSKGIRLMKGNQVSD